MNQHIEPHETDCDHDIYHVLTPSPAATAPVLSTDSGKETPDHALSSLTTAENQEVAGSNAVSSSPEPATFTETAPHVVSEGAETASDGADAPGFMRIKGFLLWLYDTKVVFSNLFNHARWYVESDPIRTKLQGFAI